MLPADSITQIQPMRCPAQRPSARQLAGTAARFTGALLAGGLIACAAWVLLFLALGTLVFSPVAGLGLPFLAVMTWFVRPLAALERRRVRWITGTPVAEAYRPLRGSLLAQVRTLLIDPGTWRDLAWLLAAIVAGGLGLAFLAALVLGPIFVVAPPIWWLLSAHPAGSHKALALVPLGIVLTLIGWWPGWCKPAGRPSRGFLP